MEFTLKCFKMYTVQIIIPYITVFTVIFTIIKFKWNKFKSKYFIQTTSVKQKNNGIIKEKLIFNLFVSHDKKNIT